MPGLQDEKGNLQRGWGRDNWWEVKSEGGWGKGSGTRQETGNLQVSELKGKLVLTRGQNCPQETRFLGPLAPLCNSFLICVFVCAKSLQLCPTLGKPMDCSPPGSSVHGVLQARILEWVAISFSWGSSHPRNWTPVSYIFCIGRWGLLFFNHQYSCLENPMDGGAWWAIVPGSHRIGHDWATSLSLFTFMHWRRKWQPTPVFLPGESQGRGSLVGCRLWGRTGLDTTEAT